jgi:hypothetical protein
MTDMTEKIVGLGIAGLVGAAFLSSAVDQLMNTNTTGWSTAVAAMWGVLGIVIIAAAILMFVKYVRE